MVLQLIGRVVDFGLVSPKNGPGILYNKAIEYLLRNGKFTVLGFLFALQTQLKINHCNF